MCLNTYCEAEEGAASILQSSKVQQIHHSPAALER